MPLIVNPLPLSLMVKEATQALHTEVEQLLLPRLSSVQSLEDYASILRMFYGYFCPLEDRLRQHIPPSVLPDLHERRKAASILHDLTNIGQDATNIERCDHLPQINNLPQALGVLYVLEGSTLGGKMIAKMLGKNKAVVLQENELTFFSGYKEDTGRKWKTFLAALNQEKNTADVVRSANETFYCLKGWMQHIL